VSQGGFQGRPARVPSWYGGCSDQSPEMRSPQNEPQIAAIAQRLRDFLVRQPGFSAVAFARDAGVAERELGAIMSPECALVDPLPMIDVIVEVVRQYGVDVNWILTGEYNPAQHRELDAEGAPTSSRIRRLIADRLPTYSPYRPTVRFPDALRDAVRG
jgi:hypothetical protein